MDDTPRRVRNDRPGGDYASDLAADVAATRTVAVKVTSEGSEPARPAATDDTLDARTSEIRQEIEQTRGEMSETIEAIQQKLSPRNIMAQATERVKTATTERVRDMAGSAEDTAHNVMNQTRETAGGLADVVRQNPIPVALIGFGAAWLLMNRRSAEPVRHDDPRTPRWSEGGGGRSRSYTSGSGRWPGNAAGDSWRGSSDESASGVVANVSESADRAASRAKDYAGETTVAIRQQGRRAQNQFERMLNESPLLVGAGALMLGAAFGMAVPETETENEWMGQTRDSVMERTQQLARDAASQVQDKVQDAAGGLADAIGTKQE